MGTTVEESIPTRHSDLNDGVTRPKSALEANVCTICLTRITERAVASPCNHLDFDFLCLTQWLQSSATCPLCKAVVDEVLYDIYDTHDFKRYVVPTILKPVTLPSQSTQPENGCQPIEDASLRFRRQVYAQGLYSLHVGVGLSGYRTYSPQAFTESQTLQTKARTFLRRELMVFQDELSGPTEATIATSAGRLRGRRGAAVTINYMIEFIIAVLRMHDPKSFDARAEGLVGDFIGSDNARLLLHELDAWLRSPYTRLREWDEAVQHPTVP